MLSADVAVDLSLTNDQQNAIEFIDQNITRCGVVALAGPAGSGKTTTIKALTALLQKTMRVTIAATTNKAAYVLRTKGIEAITFHQACMRPVFKPPLDKLGRFLDQKDLPAETKVNYPKELIEQYSQHELESALETARKSGVYAAFRQLGIKDVFKYISSWLPAGAQDGVLIIDEASMLGDVELTTAQEVYKYIVLVGDEFQLPPVKGEPVFWQIPNRVALTQIHRQAEGSQPLKLATMLRNGETVSPKPLECIDVELSRSGYPVIVWRNKTREELTKDIREALGFGNMPPQPGEVLICRNNSDRDAKQMGLINNSLWKVVASHGFLCDLQNDEGDIIEDVNVHIEELETGNGIPFRFAYALTCHSAQGSQWEKVMIHQPDAQMFWRRDKETAKRWLYTGITRAVSHVRWVTDRVE